MVRHHHFDGCRVDPQVGTGQLSVGHTELSRRIDHSSNIYARRGRTRRGGEEFSRRRARNNEARRRCGDDQLFLRRARLEEESAEGSAYEEITKEEWLS